MARPCKQGLDYFPHDCDAANDERILALEAEVGKHTAYAIVFKLYEKIFNKGGILDISTEATLRIYAGTIADMTVEEFKQFISSCVSVGLFDKKAYEKGLLTSDDIKARMKPVLDKRRNMAAVHKKNISASKTPQSKEQKRRENQRIEKKIDIKEQNNPDSGTTGSAANRTNYPETRTPSAVCKKSYKGKKLAGVAFYLKGSKITSSFYATVLDLCSNNKTEAGKVFYRAYKKAEEPNAWISQGMRGEPPYALIPINEELVNPDEVQEWISENIPPITDSDYANLIKGVNNV